MNRKLLDACDRYGMLVMDEFSDVWTTTKVDFDYGMHMAEWWEHDVTNLVNKDYNHPCVIMYSIGKKSRKPATVLMRPGVKSWRTKSAAWMTAVMWPTA